ncbi:MAG: DUF1345 domain-containing protein [Paracoccaceae bacterium]
MADPISRLPHPRFMLFLACFAGGWAVLAPWLDAGRALALGFDLAATAFLASCLILWRDERIPMNRARAARDDGGRLLLLVVAVVTLLAVLATLGGLVAGQRQLAMSDLAIVVGTLALAWLFVNLVYALHYSHLYYDQTEKGDRGGLDFPGGQAPTFADFCYFAFVIGMTCQVSDVVITASHLRRVAQLHGLLSFFFNLGVLALTINVLAGVL